MALLRAKIVSDTLTQ